VAILKWLMTNGLSITAPSAAGANKGNKDNTATGLIQSGLGVRVLCGFLFSDLGERYPGPMALALLELVSPHLPAAYRLLCLN
jgi:hypothetical protein